MIGHLFRDEATVLRNQAVSNGSGGWTTQLALHHTMRARVRSRTTEEQLVARQGGVRVGWVMYCEASADIVRGDVVEVRGFRADVRAVREPSVAGHHLMVDLDERQSGG